MRNITSNLCPIIPCTYYWCLGTPCIRNVMWAGDNFRRNVTSDSLPLKVHWSEIMETRQRRKMPRERIPYRDANKSYMQGNGSLSYVEIQNLAKSPEIDIVDMFFSTCSHKSIPSIIRFRDRKEGHFGLSKLRAIKSVGKTVRIMLSRPFSGAKITEQTNCSRSKCWEPVINTVSSLFMRS